MVWRRPAGAPFGDSLTIRLEKGGGAMTVFLFVTASVAVGMGLVGLVAGSPLWLWRTDRKRGPPLCGRWAHRT
jgi:hypothetical protein